MRLLPRTLPPSPSAPAEEGASPLGEQARRALALLADGYRYADMARELNLSESGVRKLVQRTVHDLGARTRCQAVAIAARAKRD
jgi:DNA-binding NarL/FixJ family response regulator